MISISHRWMLLVRVIIRPECASEVRVDQVERKTARCGAGRDGKVPAMNAIYSIFLAILLPTASIASDSVLYEWLDGDTVRGAGSIYRLAAIDCPESDQPGGVAARELAARWHEGVALNAYVETTDKYGRKVAHICKAGTNPLECINDLLVEAGLCWVYEQYASDHDKMTLLPLQAHAQAERLGIWSDPNPIPPWEWRRGKR